MDQPSAIRPSGIGSQGNSHPRAQIKARGGQGWSRRRLHAASTARGILRILAGNSIIGVGSCSFTEISVRPVSHFGASGIAALMKLLLFAAMAFALLYQPLNLELKTQKSDPGGQIEAFEGSPGFWAKVARKLPSFSWHWATCTSCLFGRGKYRLSGKYPSPF